MNKAYAVAAATVAVLVVAWWCRGQARVGPDRGGFCPGPHNVGLFDRPYQNYPSYEGRGATSWDGERRCTAWCQQSPCAVWCR